MAARKTQGAWHGGPDRRRPGGPDGPDDPGGGNAPEFSVSELSGAIKRVIEGEFGHVRLRGEVGRVARPRSGHLYLDLKDDRAVIAGVIWKGVAARLTTQPEEGMEVIATGRVTTFGGQSKYQVIIEDIQPAGQGALMAMLEQRKKKLAAEGLFEPAHKAALPFLPGVIGVVTSPSGAVIRDILHRLRERFPRKVLIWPVAVQGAACAPEVARAIRGFNALAPGGAVPRPDVLIVARGGGSIEDLWGFNEEEVARAAFASGIPLISAVGHETDTTLIDFAADKRAPTPTAAAEIAVPVRMELLGWLDGQSARLVRALTGTSASAASACATWRARCRGPSGCWTGRASASTPAPSGCRRGWCGRCNCAGCGCRKPPARCARGCCGARWRPMRGGWKTPLRGSTCTRCAPTFGGAGPTSTA